MTWLSLAYDMRAPEWGAPPQRLYHAAVEQAEWAAEDLAVLDLVSGGRLLLTVGLGCRQAVSVSSDKGSVA